MRFPVFFSQEEVSSPLSQFPIAKSISLSFAKRSVLPFMQAFQSVDGDSANKNQLINCLFPVLRLDDIWHTEIWERRNVSFIEL